MKRRMMTGLAVLLTVLVLLLAPAAAIGERVHTDLTGYEETPLTISTPATGDFKAKIENDGTLVSWELSYRDTLSAVTQAHIHFGAPAISGGIVVFLCTNLGNAPVGAQLCRPRSRERLRPPTSCPWVRQGRRASPLANWPRSCARSAPAPPT